jgi:hypothetical protein
MPEQQQAALSSRTYVIGADDFEFETITQNNGLATVVRFKLGEDNYGPGDILLVLDGTDIHFHGMIGQVDEERYAFASDPRGSLLPATVQ